MNVPMRWLIVTADDFGFTSGVNRAIVEAHRGSLTARYDSAASVLATTVSLPVADAA